MARKSDKDSAKLTRLVAELRTIGVGPGSDTRVVIFSEPLCKIVEQYLKKGAKVYIEGALQTRKWTDQAGVEKYSTEVVLQGFNSSLTMLDGRSSGGSGNFAADDSNGDFGAGGPSAAAPRRAVAAGARNGDMDDDIPF